MKIYKKNTCWLQWSAIVLSLVLLVGCVSVQESVAAPKEIYQTSTTQQYIKFKPINLDDFAKQVTAIKETSPSLYQQYRKVYEGILDWSKNGVPHQYLADYDITVKPLDGKKEGQVHFTGYFTPVLQAKRQPDEQYRYPLYRKPKQKDNLPSRKQIYAGALKGLELAYTNSPVDNFFLEVQGSGYIDFIDEDTRYFFRFSGKNGYKYRSVGRILMEKGEISRKTISAQAIKNWAKKKDEKTVLSMLSLNPSVVFFSPQKNVPVSGSSGVPLVAKASVASDRSIVPTGSVLLVEMPIQNKNGRLTGKKEMRLMIALDVGSAIKGQHLDIYHGIGDEAGNEAGFYNHYGRVWMLN